MKTKVVLAICLLVIPFLVIAQKKTTLSLNIKSVEVVILKCSSKTVLKSVKSEQLNVTSEMNIYGKVWGFQSPSKRPEFLIQYTISNDTLYIETPKVFAPATIGVSTYKEEINSTLEIPFDKKVIVKHADLLHFNSYFNQVVVNRANVITGFELRKEGLARLYCHAKETLFINNRNDIQVYEFNGVGTSSIYLTGDEIKLTIK